MKKQNTLLALSLSLLLVGCSTDEAQAPEDTETEEQTTEEVDEAAVEEEDQTTDVQYVLNEASWRVEPAEGSEADSQVVLMTFDDAPDKYAVEMAETLSEHDVPAIFFVNGMFIDSEEGQEQLQAIHDMGFAIGNHTYNHPNLQQVSDEVVEAEILDTSDKVEEIIGERPRFFRAPFGANTDFSKQVAEDDGMLVMNWSYGYDWEQQYMDPDALADIMVNTEFLSDGANLLMHDRDWTNQALEDIILGLEEKGYGFVDPETIEGGSTDDI